MVLKFKIKGIDCANCAAELERGINKIEGVDNAVISFMTERLTVEFEDSKKEEVLEKVKKFVKKEEPDAKIESI